ncbi:MAG: hypothetical protein OXC91_08065, partial [Rhodobacteraceae bacterium]|nr:hypothetical protein [Paracoccaceae bacterium]
MVSFGGNWSEELLINHHVQTALDAIDRAALDCVWRDVVDPDLEAALTTISDCVKKGPQLASALRAAVTLTNTGLRQREARCIAGRIRA